MLVATAAHCTRKVSIGSQLPGSCGLEMVILPAARAGAAVKAVAAMASATNVVVIPFLIIVIYLFLFRWLWFWLLFRRSSR